MGRQRRINVHVSGEVDLATAPDLEKLLIWSLRGGPAQVTIDLSRVEFFSAAGLNLLTSARLVAQRQGARTRIVTGQARSISLGRAGRPRRPDMAVCRKIIEAGRSNRSSSSSLS